MCPCPEHLALLLLAAVPSLGLAIAYVKSKLPRCGKKCCKEAE